MKFSLLAPLSRFVPRKLLDSIALVIIALVIFQMLTIGLIFSRMIYGIIEGQTEKRALQAAKYIAMIPELKQDIQTLDEYGLLQPLTESIRQEAAATQITITDNKGIQISSTDSRQIGSLFVEPGESRALRYGRSYLSRSNSPEGLIIYGNAPIFNSNLDIIGMVSVGYLVENVRGVTRGYLEKLLFYIWIFVTLGLISAILIARGVKKAIFGLEPHEIASLYQERDAIIASIREGIIATDKEGTITMLNQTAIKQLGGEYLNRNISQCFPDIDFSQVLAQKKQICNREIIAKGTRMIFNMVPIIFAEEIRGAVATYRRKDEVDLISHELSQITAYSDMLRAQTHEYSNRLHTIVGMVQVGAYDEVLDFIAEETSDHKRLIRLLAESVPDPTISSFLIGKYMYALELKVEFSIDPESHMAEIPNDMNRHQLLTVLGNVLDNAFEAALSRGLPAKVNLFMSDFGNDLIFEIEDSGYGVPEDMINTIFAKGVSTKEGKKRGYGLHLVKRTLQSMNGGIGVQNSSLGGALFIIEIPKRVGVI